jgi:hypothetical protein
VPEPFVKSRLLKTAAVLVLLGVVPSVVRASCGDWLAHSSASENSSQGEVSDGMTENVRHGHDTLPGPGKTPCRGPACRQSPDVPTPNVPPEHRPPVPDELGTGILTGIAASASFISTRPSESLLMVSGKPWRVDRPPEL